MGAASWGALCYRWTWKTLLPRPVGRIVDPAQEVGSDVDDSHPSNTLAQHTRITGREASMHESGHSGALKLVLICPRGRPVPRLNDWVLSHLNRLLLTTSHAHWRQCRPRQ